MKLLTEEEGCRIAYQYGKENFANFEFGGIRFQKSSESPDGEWVVYLQFANNEQSDDYATVVVDAKTGDVRVIQSL